MTSNSPKIAFDKQGHRGSRGLMPENTIPAMLHALDLDVTTLEMDVVITKDKQVILSHEPFFNYDITTKPDGSFVTQQEERGLNIYTMSYSNVTTYDVGMRPHPRFPQQVKLKVVKPSLRELIDSVEVYLKEKKLPLVHYNIETKSNPLTDNLYHPEPDAFVDLLMEVIKERKIEQRTIIQSFDIRTLQYLHSQYPTIRTALLIEDYDKKPLPQQLEQLGFTPTIYSPHYSLVNKELIQLCKQQKMKIIPWTVNDAKTIQALTELGVDGIITDYPDLFK
jgi:glycerophosphoryl diester phosphodiesterase